MVCPDAGLSKRCQYRDTADALGGFPDGDPVKA
jgi:hypothetical protein